MLINKYNSKHKRKQAAAVMVAQGHIADTQPPQKSIHCICQVVLMCIQNHLNWFNCLRKAHHWCDRQTDTHTHILTMLPHLYQQAASTRCMRCDLKMNYAHSFIHSYSFISLYDTPQQSDYNKRSSQFEKLRIAHLLWQWAAWSPWRWMHRLFHRHHHGVLMS